MSILKIGDRDYLATDHIHRVTGDQAGRVTVTFIVPGNKSESVLSDPDHTARSQTHFWVEDYEGEAARALLAWLANVSVNPLKRVPKLKEHP
jgi:hypothetical protein